MERTTKEESVSNIAQRIFMIAFLAALGWTAIVAQNPRTIAPASAPPQGFSAERAFEHVKVIAQKPHPMGSTEIAEVRAYITGQLKQSGLEVKSESFPVRHGDRTVKGVNLIARIPGTHHSGTGQSAVALVCHHDSVSVGPGASDDGAGVATLLETARALQAGAPLKNDILFIFTDGEEADLDGARAFAASSALTNVALVLNFDARGVSGPVFMFETSTGNGKLISEFAQAVERPAANSLMYEVYRHMPNDTDLTIFKKAGVPGLNFAFIGGPQFYHTAQDDPAHFSVRTLQHEGDYALSLARHFGNIQLGDLTAPDAVYFDVLGTGFVHYPGSAALPLSSLAAVLFLALAVWARQKRGATFGAMILGALAWGVNLLIIGLLFRYVRFGAGGLMLWAISLAATLSISLALFLILRKWIPAPSFALGGLAWWTVLAIVTALWLPGASYVPLWPVLAGLLAVIALNGRPSWVRFLALLLAAIPALILVTPLVHKFYIALGPAALFVPMIVFALEFAVLLPQIAFIAAPPARKVPLISPEADEAD